MFWPVFIAAKIIFLLLALTGDLPSREWIPLFAGTAAGEILVYMACRRYALPTAGFKILPAFAGALVFAVTAASDLAVFAAFQKPLDTGLMSEGASAMPVTTMLALLTWWQWVLIAMPLALLLLRLGGVGYWRFPAFQFPGAARRPPVRYVLGATLVLLLAGFVGYPSDRFLVVPPVLRLPMLTLAQNFSKTETSALHAAGGKNTPALAAFNPGKPPLLHAGSRNLGTNIVFIVLESTGSRYIFDEKLTRPGQGVPMPFLKKLSGESLNLRRHYATANSSPRALFSIFTGLYPEAAEEFFSLKRTLAIRTLNRFTDTVSQWLVTPCATEWYFPNGLFKNNGMTDIVGKSRLVFSESLTEPSDARNEIQAADYFAARLRTAAEPFFAVYISFAPHYPYHDYGDAWRIAPGTTRLDRYVNNLRLLDKQLEKFMMTLEKRGVLGNTAVVIVGDHSEAFKQHKGNYIHSLHSYEENLSVPALIYFPQRVKPGEITTTTSHVDLVPTLLDLLQIEHSPREFQGESVVRPLSRKYIYAYGNEGTVTAYDRGSLKVQRLKNGQCRLFDLAKDENEASPAACETGHDAFLSADQYLRSQLALLQRLQESIAKR